MKTGALWFLIRRCPNMLVLPLKPAERYDIFTALAQWLDSDHHISFEPRNPLQFILPKPEFCSVACRDELLLLQSLRNHISDALLKTGSHKSAVEEGALEDLEQYHAVLLEFEKRGFPTIDDSLTGIHLTWKSAWEGRSETHASLVWERANTIYNIVALKTSRAATVFDPTERDSCKQAVSYYQSGAGLLALLRQLVEPEDYASVEFSNALLTFWESALLAQAQSCIYRMAALAPNANHATLSVLAQSAHELFNDALNAAQDPRLVSEVPKPAQDEWAPFCKANSMLCGAKAEYHDAVVHRLDHKWGREIARLRVCREKLQACQDFCQSAHSATAVDYTLRECKAILAVVHDRLVEADRDNYKIYQDQIPKKLPPIQGKQLAKCAESLPDTMLRPSKPLFTTV